MSETVTIKSVGPATGPNQGGYYAFKVELEDGRKGEAAGKTNQFRFNPGSIVTMEINSTEKYGVKFTKLNAVQAAPQESQYTPDPQEGYTPTERVNTDNPRAVQSPDDRRQKLIVLQSSLKEAIQFHHAAGYIAQEPAGQMAEAYNTAEFFAEKIFNSDLAK